MDVLFDAVVAFFVSRVPFGWKMAIVLLMCTAALGGILIATQ